MEPSPAALVTSSTPLLHLGQLIVEGRPWSLNAERSAHWREHRRTTEAVRTKVAYTARQSLRTIHPSAFPIIVEAFPVQKGRLPDAGNSYPTVKAIIDGLVDADILPDDDPKYVDAVVLQSPRRATKGEPEHVTINLWTTQ